MEAGRFFAALVSAGAIVATLPGAALPAGASGPFGRHVAECAQAHRGQRGPPAVVCTHDGHVHAFADFGETVRHMLQHHGA